MIRAFIDTRLRSGASNMRLLDDAIGSQQHRWRNGQAKHARCRPINRKLERNGLLDRQLGRFAPLRSCQRRSPRAGTARNSSARMTPDHRPRRICARRTCWEIGSCGHVRDQLPALEVGRISKGPQSIRPARHRGCQTRRHLVRSARCESLDFHSRRLGRGYQFAYRQDSTGFEGSPALPGEKLSAGSPSRSSTLFASSVAPSVLSPVILPPARKAFNKPHLSGNDANTITIGIVVVASLAARSPAWTTRR